MSQTINVFEYMDSLKEVGVPAEQAEVHAKTLAKTIDNNLATKQDIKLLRNDIKEVEEKLINKITIRVGIMLFFYTGFLIGILNFMLAGHLK
jgi:hypothetical protein